MSTALEVAKDRIERLGVPFIEAAEGLSEDDETVLREWFVRTPSVPNLVVRQQVKASVPTVSGTEFGYTGDVCGFCGGSRMVRSGPSCLKCLDCGEAGGCG